MAEKVRLRDAEIGNWRSARCEHPISNLQSPNLFMIFLLLLATLLRFYRLDSSSLWSDEGNSWAMLSRSFGEIAAAAAADIHPPGYYWLLKVWSLIVGDSAAAMRSLSALLGVLLVVLIAAIAQRIVRQCPGWQWFPALAVLAAAINPFQIYYSQEARMYMLLAVEAVGLFWALLWLVETGDWRVEIGRWRHVEIEGADNLEGGASPDRRSPIADRPITQSPNRFIPQSLFLLFGAAGMWTHYSFPIVLAAAGLTFVLWWLISLRRVEGHGAPLASLLHFLALNLLILLAFLPWLPTAIDSVLHWPKGGVAISTVDGLAMTLRTLLFGPLRTMPDPLWPWLLIAGVLPIISLIALRRLPFGASMLGLWLLLPVAMMFGLGLFSDAFLKFLLVVSPAWCLLVAATPWSAPAGRMAQVMLHIAVIGFAIGVAWATLPAYYADAYARDNYQGVARYLAAVGDPATDLVVLDAPGQQEVWRYYDPGLPVLALPAQHPPVAAAIEAELAAATTGKRRVFTLLWATDEADPDQLVERWLDGNAFKALESWQGNLRFAAYALAGDLAATAIAPVQWENGMLLTRVQQPQPTPQRVTPGNAATIQLTWLTTQALTQRYKVSVQLLDARNQVIAQHDGEPGGGAHPTDRWQIGAAVIDNHGIAIPFGVPPGRYRMIAVLYAADTGERVRQSGQDVLPLGEVEVERAARTPPLAVVPMQHRLDEAAGPVRLVGYDAYRRGFAHAPETLIQPGDTVHFTLYWQAPAPLPATWPADLTLTLRLGEQTISTPLAGGAYPTSAWQAGELVRGEFDLLYTGGTPRPVLSVEDTTITLHRLPM